MAGQPAPAPPRASPALAPAHKTKTTLAAEALRESLAAGQLSPGQRIDVRRMAADLGMSITPVREALRLLQADGLVSYDEHRRISAAALSPEDADEVYVLRAMLEGMATERAAARRLPDDLSRIDRAQSDLESALAAGDPIRAHQANRAWHFAIYRAAGTRYTLAFITRLWSLYEWHAIWGLPGRLDQSVAEHRVIGDAIALGEPGRAGALLRRHIETSRQAIETLRSQP
ncbi:MAG: GntR family transcriptional regulator [Acidimicrobiales bacterium]